MQANSLWKCDVMLLILLIYQSLKWNKSIVINYVFLLVVGCNDVL